MSRKKVGRVGHVSFLSRAGFLGPCRSVSSGRVLELRAESAGDLEKLGLSRDAADFLNRYVDGFLGVIEDEQRGSNLADDHRLEGIVLVLCILAVAVSAPAALDMLFFLGCGRARSQLQTPALRVFC